MQIRLKLATPCSSCSAFRAESMKRVAKIIVLTTVAARYRGKGIGNAAGKAYTISVSKSSVKTPSVDCVHRLKPTTARMSATYIIAVTRSIKPRYLNDICAVNMTLLECIHACALPYIVINTKQSDGDHGLYKCSHQDTFNIPVWKKRRG